MPHIEIKVAHYYRKIILKVGTFIFYISELFENTLLFGTELNKTQYKSLKILWDTFF